MADSVNDIGQVVHKNNPVPQPNHHWGDGLERDALAWGNFRMPVNEAGSSEIYAFGGYSHRDGIGNPYRRYQGSARSWDQIYPLGFLPNIEGLVTDYSMAGGLRGLVGGWNYDIGATSKHWVALATVLRKSRRDRFVLMMFLSARGEPVEPRARAHPSTSSG